MNRQTKKKNQWTTGKTTVITGSPYKNNLDMAQNKKMKKLQKLLPKVIKMFKKMYSSILKLK